MTSRFIRRVLILGAVSGLLIAAMRLVEYRFLVIDHSTEIYGAIVAAAFAAVGIWLGQYLRRPRVVVKEVVVGVPVEVRVPAYRDNVAAGQLTFGQGFTVGLLITLVSCLCYVVTWQIVYYNFIPDFMDRYAAYMVEQLRASGESAAVIEEKAREMQAFKAMYANPLVNAAFTFLEPFPVGLLMTVISAALLRAPHRKV